MVAAVGRLAGIVVLGVVVAGCSSSSAPRSEAETGPELSTERWSELFDRSIEEMNTASRSDLPELRANAIEALMPWPDQVRIAIARGLDDDNLGVRTVALVAMGNTKNADFAEAARRLLADESPYVRAAAIYALAEVGADVDRTPLATMLLEDPSPQVRSHAAVLLGLLEDPSASPLLREAAAARMPMAGEIEVSLMRLQIAEALVRVGDRDQIQVIRAALYPSRPGDLEATALAAQILGEVGDRGSIDELISLVDRRDEQGNPMPIEVRLVAVRSLAGLGNTRGAFVAREALESDRGVVKAQAALVLGDAGGLEDVPALAGLLRDESPRVRLAAAAGLARILDRNEQVGE